MFDARKEFSDYRFSFNSNVLIDCLQCTGIYKEGMEFDIFRGKARGCLLAGRGVKAIL
jgi:hypothetical protein